MSEPLKHGLSSRQSEMLLRIISAQQHGLDTSIPHDGRSARGLQRRGWIKWVMGGASGYGRWEPTSGALDHFGLPHIEPALSRKDQAG